MNLIQIVGKIGAFEKGASADVSPQSGGNLRGVWGTYTGALTTDLTTLRAVFPKDRGCAASERRNFVCSIVDMEIEQLVRTQFFQQLPQYTARMHTYGLLPPTGALICCWDPWYGRAWAESAWKLRAGWVVRAGSLQEPKPKRARSTSPRSTSPAGAMTAFQIDLIAQDKPLRMIALALLCSKTAGTKLKVKDAFVKHQAVHSKSKETIMARLRQTLGETVNQWIETGFASAPQPAVQSPTGVAMVVRVEAATPAATPAATSVPLDLRESAERIETLEARDDMGQRVAEGRPPPSRSRGQIWWL